MITCMMLAAALSLAQPAQTKNFDYGGLPTLSSPAIAIQDVNVTISLYNGTATTKELILFKNTTNGPVDATLTVPRYRFESSGTAFPSFPVSATWNKAAMTLTDGAPAKGATTGTFTSPLSSAVHFAPDETVALRIQYATKFGTTGYGGNQSIAGFLLTAEPAAIPQINISFNYSQKTVFDLPKVSPAWVWQVGRNGAAVRLSNYVPRGQLADAVFYGGGFDSIH